jgi:excisionase family DNA binding protein
MTQDEIRRALQEQLTVPVWPTAAGALGLSRNPTYEAVRRGDIPSIRVGGAIRVPAAALRQMLGLDPKTPA